MSIENLRILSETTVVSYPEESLQRFIDDAIVEIDNVKEKIISRLEDYPCCLSCYGTVEEVRAARAMKENMIRIIKGELL